MPIQWKPFRDMEKPSFPETPEGFDDERWVPFVPTFHSEGPAIDIYQDKNNLYVEMPLAGVKPKDVKVSLEEDILTVESKTEEKQEKHEKDYLRREIRKGSFRRTIKLPTDVKAGQTKAEAFEGILKITLPKAAKSTSKAKEIPISVK